LAVGIIGSGFGLYGYLPALVIGCRQHVILAARYKAILLSRPDVASLTNAVIWADDDDHLLSLSSALIIARRPADSLAICRSALEHNNIKRILIEKPIAPTPELAAAILNQMSAARIAFDAGYNFHLTPWSKSLADHLKTVEPHSSIHIEWDFRAHHYRFQLQNWKRHHEDGGGALRFYGIHIVALLARLGFKSVAFSSAPRVDGDVKSWSARLLNSENVACDISVKTDADETAFRVFDNAQPFSVKQCSPYDNIGRWNDYDGRVPVVADLCREFLSLPEREFNVLHNNIVELWHRLEQADV
jgi:predicted dehydrogenase